jgi:tRNA(fMet)-specific endonuclease VapC
MSDYFRRSGRVAERMHAVPPHELAVSAITEHEMRYGLARLRSPGALAQRVTRFLSVVQVLPFDREDAAASAVIRAELARKGQPIGPYDALIGGVARARELVLVTSNVGEFERVAGLEVENWRA